MSTSFGIRVAVAAACALAAGRGVLAAETVTRRFDPQDLARGRSDGVAIDSAGNLFLAPQVDALLREPSRTNASQVWSAAVDGSGNVFLGTGPDGRIVRLTPSGTETVYFVVDEPMVTALTFDDDGALLAGTSPEGKVYRITAEGRGQPWCETGARYVWTLARGRDGAVFAGTGERGVVYRISASGSAEPWFDTDEAHVVSLAALPDGSLLAGGAGRGRVYRVDPSGNGEVLHDDELPEVSEVIPRADGSIVALLLGPTPGARRSPSLRIRLPQGAEMGATTDPLAELEGDRGPGLVGVIEDLPEAARAPSVTTCGRVVVIDPDGAVREVWRSSTESVFAGVLADDGEVLFGTGEPARVYGLSTRDRISRLAEFDEGQSTVLLRSGPRVLLATSNPGVAYGLGWERSEPGAYLSPVLDASAPARWGLLRWTADRSSGVEFFTRTGNSAEPDSTWSAWSPALTDPVGSRTDNPVGRYLQWRVKLTAVRGDGAQIRDVTLSYSTLNRAPQVRNSRAATRPWLALSAPATLEVEARDPDGDPLQVRFQIRDTSSAGWRTIGVADSSRPDTDPSGWRSVRVTVDPAELPDGEREGRWEVSDHPGNSAERALLADDGRIWRVLVDRTPPVVQVESGSGRELRVRAEDALSSLAALEVVVDGRLVSTEPPLDGVCDGRSESFVVRVPDGRPVVLRVRDDAGNVAEITP